MEQPRHRGIVIFYAMIVGSAYIAIRLFREGRSYPGTGWTIITVLFIFLVGLEKYLKHKDIRITAQSERVKKTVDTSNPEYMDNLNVLISTKDPVKVHAVANVLRENNIEYSVLDCQMSHMIPGVEIRVMVRGKDMEESIKLIKSIGVDA